MTPSEYFASAFVVFICILTRLRNWTVVALALSFLIVHAVWAVTQASASAMLPLEIMCDYAVIIAVLVKGAPVECVKREIRRVPGHAGTVLHALRKCRNTWDALSRGDQAVLALFAPAWTAYAAEIGEWPRYWVLWSLGLLQLCVAGAEGFATWRRGRAVKPAETPAEPFLRWGLAVDGC